MKRTTKYVAFDVHQATTVASVREDSGRVIARSVLPTAGGVITEFAARATPLDFLGRTIQADWPRQKRSALSDAGVRPSQSLS